MKDEEIRMKTGKGLTAYAAEAETGEGTDESPPVNIPAGDIQFYDRYRPRIAPGVYTIQVTQGVNEPDDGSLARPGPPLSAPYVAQQQFTVLGPRFRLDPSDIYSVFPPANALGDYSDSLPHIVLTRRTLPWERTTGEDTGSTSPPADDSPPWMALLLFDDEEVLSGDSPPSNAASATKVQTLPLNEVINLDIVRGDILGPQRITLDASEPDVSAQCLAVDVQPQAFLAVVPQLAELQYLAHCREVNTGNKEIPGLDADGWFSVVMGNRVPACDRPASSPASAPDSQGAKNIAHLVSLEGLQDYLLGGPQTIPANIKRVRLVSLASWTFTCFSQGLNFGTLMANLRLDLLRVPQGHASPLSSPADKPAAHELACEALEGGYAPINYTTLEGEQTVAWYRGPLVPYVTARVERDPFITSDAAMIYDRETGLFDLSYAVAWQIGRQLCLADREFSISLLQWQREAQRLIDLLLERRQLVQSLGETLGYPNEAAALVQKGFVRQRLAHYLMNGFAALVLPQDPEASPLLPGRDPTGLRQRQDDMPGLLSAAEVSELLAAGADPAQAWREKMFARRRDVDEM
jgi:hypothetical protein